MSLDYLSEICESFQENPGYNPISGRRIAIGGPIYQEISGLCGFESDRIDQEALCMAYLRNPFTNPLTDRPISSGGPTQKILNIICRVDEEEHEMVPIPPPQLTRLSKNRIIYKKMKNSSS